MLIGVSSPTLDRSPSSGPLRPASAPSPSRKRPAALAAGVLGGVRRLAESLATPLVPADYLDLLDPLRHGAELRGRIVEIRPETADAATVVIRPGRDWAGHLPGQYIRIGVDIDGVRHWRAYSLTHRVRAATPGYQRPAPADVPHGCVSITVKAIPDGLVSNHLVRRALPGALVMLDQATGDFTLPQRPAATALFLTAGSGITPVMGMLRNRSEELADVVHVHCAPSRPDVIFADELTGLRSDAYRLVLNVDDEHGVLDLDGLDDLVPDWRERQAWVCGPTGLLDAAEALWERAGLADSLHTERFRPSVVEPGEGGEVTFLGSDVSVAADGATPILDAGEDAGVLMPSGCRMGICFGCVVTLRAGAVRDLRTGEVTAIESDETVPIQTCINAVAGTCDIDL